MTKSSEKHTFATSSIVIAIPAFNEERFVGRTLKSLEGQTFKNFTVLIADNASSDATYDICRSFAERDARFRLHRHAENLGAYGNSVWLLNNASSEFFMLLGAHDQLAPTYLEDAMESFRNHPNAVLSFSNTVIFNDDGEVTKMRDGGNYHRVNGNSAERFRGIFWKIGPCEAVNNLFRRSALLTKPLPRVASSDRVMLCRAATLGTFVKVDKPNYYKRMIENRQGGSDARMARVTGNANERAARLPVARLLWREYSEIDRSLTGRFSFFLMLLWKFGRKAAKDHIRRGRGLLVAKRRSP